MPPGLNFGGFDALEDFRENGKDIGFQEEAQEMLKEEEERVDDEDVAYQIEEAESD